MALSKIWSAFVIIAVLVAIIKLSVGDEKIFTRMVTGKSSDKYDSTFYYAIGSPVNQKLSFKYTDFLKEYGYHKTDSIKKAMVVLTDNFAADSVTLLKAMHPNAQVYTYASIQKKLTRKVFQRRRENRRCTASLHRGR